MAYATESALEKNFSAWCQVRDIIPIKGPSMFAKGIPDRYVQLPDGGGTIYIEFKGTSYYGLTAMQRMWKDYLINSSPNRYFLVENTDELDALKKRCLEFIDIGKELVSYETSLLEKLVTPKE